jgi:hypothetical protein
VTDEELNEIEALIDLSGVISRPPQVKPENVPLTACEQAQTLEIVTEEPRSTRRAVSEMARRLKKSVAGR